MSDYHVCSDARFLSRLDGFELIPHILRALATGKPVALDEIATAAGAPSEEVRRLLRSQPGTDWDGEGRLVGFGLTPVPTDHRFIVDGTPLYTWCATDTLIFTVILGGSAIVESSCPATGQPVSIALNANALVSVTPSEAVVSQRHHGELLGGVRAQVCDHGHFFASPSAANDWTAEHPHGVVLSVADAFDHARAACQELGWTPVYRGPDLRPTT